MGGAVAGSVIGHGISSMIFGSGRPVDQSRADVPPPAEYAQAARAESGGCDIPAKGEYRTPFEDEEWERGSRNSGPARVSGGASFGCCQGGTGKWRRRSDIDRLGAD